MNHENHGGGGGGGGAGGLQATNKHLAESYWYIIAGATGFAAAIRGINYLEGRRRLRRHHTQSLAHPTKPDGRLTQAWATATAMVREAAYPRFFVPKKGLRWASPPSLGRILLLVAYWAVIINMMTAHGAIIKDVFYWERIGFRNGWTTIMQMPLLYLLSMKFNIIGYLTGTSHERLNWLHRWVGRTMFVTATVHGFHFWTQWERAEIIEMQMKILPITKQGLGAWALLLWTILTTFKPFRHMAYELFIVQHILTAIIFLWLVYVHIPEPARPYLWFSVACICFDRLARWSLLLWQNLRPKPDRSDCKGMKRIGHQAQVRTVGSSTTVLTIKDVSFSWKAGQHLYLWLPRLGPFEAHPYTIACAHQLPETCICNSVQLVIRKHGGFSKRLHNHAQKMQQAGRSETLTAFVVGPFGAPPRWDIYETVILISASTGASFTLPILEAIVQERAKTCVKRVEFVLTACQGEEIDFYLQRLREAVDRAHGMGLELTVHVAITRSDANIEAVTSVLNGDGRVGTTESLLHRRGNSSSSDAEGGEMEEKDSIRAANPENQPGCHMMKGSCCAGGSSSSGGSDFLRQYTTRLDIESLIREPVEAAGGETSVVVCGGQSLTSSVRNCVTRLSDERAVHKGTGAQGIHLYVEEYSF